MNKTTKTIIIVAVVVAVSYYGYTWYKKKKAAATVTTGTAPGTAQTPSSGSNIVGDVSAAWSDVSNLFG